MRGKGVAEEQRGLNIGGGGWRTENGEREGGWEGEGRTKKRSMKEEGYAGHAMVLTCAKYGTTRASSSRVH